MNELEYQVSLKILRIFVFDLKIFSYLVGLRDLAQKSQTKAKSVQQIYGAYTYVAAKFIRSLS